MDTLTAADVANAVRALAFVLAFLVAGISAIATILIRRRYVAAVVRLQGRSESQSAEIDSASLPNQPIAIIEEQLSVHRGDTAWSVLRLRRRVLAAQVVGDLFIWIGCGAFSFVPALASILVATIRNHDVPTLRLAVRAFATLNPIASPLSVDLFFVLLWVVMPPAMITAAQTAVRPWQRYVPVALAAAVWVAAAGRASSWNFEAIALVAALAAAGALIAFLHDPRVRGAASPLIIAFGASMFGWAALGIAVALRYEDFNQPDAGVSASDALAMAAYALGVVATTPGVLHVLGHAYQRKRVSDIQLARLAFSLLTIVAVFGAGALQPNTTGGTGLLVTQSGVLAIWICSVAFIQHLVRRQFMRVTPASAGALLILRVFKRPSRSETFVDRLLSFWRFAGPVHFIAGPDLAGATIEPDQFFSFLRGRFADRFVRAPNDVERQIDRLDHGRDPDGRFRMNELFCTDATWRAAVNTLMRHASVVLLDLREYTASRAGTRYEIAQLMNVVPLDRIVVLVGMSDDMNAIRAELARAWRSMSEASPNRRFTQPELRVCRLRSGSAGDVKALFLRTYAVATTGLTTGSLKYVGPAMQNAK